ncbi:MAG: hypothetical protein JOY71_16310 [Acetobacteraceae bacterium]|nr:hypothetical protein [Acetobacteraceae bacterium]
MPIPLIGGERTGGASDRNTDSNPGGRAGGTAGGWRSAGLKPKHPAASYRYDASLLPALEWDSNSALEAASFLMAGIDQAAALPAPHLFEQRWVCGADGAPLLEVAGLQDALAGLKKLQRPFRNWVGKAERPEFEVPSLPLSCMAALHLRDYQGAPEAARPRPDARPNRRSRAPAFRPDPRLRAPGPLGESNDPR